MANKKRYTDELFFLLAVLLTLLLMCMCVFCVCCDNGLNPLVQRWRWMYVVCMRAFATTHAHMPFTLFVVISCLAFCLSFLSSLLAQLFFFILFFTLHLSYPNHHLHQQSNNPPSTVPLFPPPSASSVYLQPLKPPSIPLFTLATCSLSLSSYIPPPAFHPYQIHFLFAFCPKVDLFPWYLQPPNYHHHLFFLLLTIRCRSVEQLYLSGEHTTPYSEPEN